MMKESEKPILEVIESKTQSSGDEGWRYQGLRIKLPRHEMITKGGENGKTL
jgi:hypothetical protein